MNSNRCAPAIVFPSYYSFLFTPILAMAMCLCSALALSAGGASLSVDRLRCEYLANPLGIDAAQPRLGWNLVSKERGQVQSAYQILVSSTEKKLKENSGDLWDSGRVPSDIMLQVPYAGKPLESGQRCYWKVRAWDHSGKASDFSAPAYWEMGLLKPGDWRGKWIGRNTSNESQPAPMLRREFKLPAKVVRARAYICGLGYYELQINGKKLGNSVLDPAFTRYDRRDLYEVYDVTDVLRRGDNAVGVLLGTGWYNVHTKAVWDFHKAPWRAAPKLLFQMHIEYADGKKQVLVSDERWKTSTGPIVFDSIYGGETYDARLEVPGWAAAGFDDSKWAPAEIVESPGGQLSAQLMPPIQVTETLKPVRVTEPKPGVFVYDIGQNMAGCVQLSVRGSAGTKVVMRYGERLRPDGNLDTADIEQHIKRLDTNQQFQTDTYILKGKGLERWNSRFTYHGFQYVEVTGFPGKPALNDLVALFAHSAIPQAGEFECSNPMFAKILRAGRWAYLSNLQGIPTDCPHREKNGWTGDAHLAAEQGLFNYEPAPVYRKWVGDLRDEQKLTGELPGIVPTSGWGYSWGNGPAWDSSLTLIPLYLYGYCADSRTLVDSYDSMKRYVDYLTSKADNGIVSIGLNDWAPYKTQTPADITSTAYYYRGARIVALAAQLAGKEDEAKAYSRLAAQIRRAFNNKFFHPDTGLYGNGSQTSLSCALYQGLVEESERQRVVNNLVAAVDKTDGHIDTGILGAKYILNALTDNGRADVAYRIASQKDLPSWGHWLEQGATTLWEQWNGTESRNHIMFGDILAWFYKSVAGINPDYTGPGFQRFVVRPQPVGDLTWAQARYQSQAGLIRSEWRISKGKFELSLTVPANTRARVYLPTADVSEVTEGGKQALRASGVAFLRVEQGATLMEVGSGDYKFACPAPKLRDAGKH